MTFQQVERLFLVILEVFVLYFQWMLNKAFEHSEKRDQNMCDVYNTGQNIVR